MEINKFNNFILKNITVGELIGFLSQYEPDTKISFNDHPLLHVSVNSPSDREINCYAMNPEGSIPNYENDDKWTRLEDLMNPMLSTLYSRVEQYRNKFSSRLTQVTVNGRSRIKVYYNGLCINFTS